MWCSRITNRVVLTLAIGMVATAAEAGSIIYVDDDSCAGPGGDGSIENPYCSIQTGIDVAMDGDEVVVAPGFYFETVNFLGKAITVRSSDGADVTTIDAEQTGTVVTCDSAEGPDSVLEGFTITGGNAEFGGGMVNIDFSSPTVTNCIFSRNTALIGGGMYNAFRGSPTVINCTFSENSGGGMYNDDTSSPTVTECTFYANTTNFANGGGMTSTGGSPIITSCTFSENSSDLWGGGMANCGSPVITNCTFSGNSSVSGGGMFNAFGSPTVTDCTFSGNTAENSGGGMFNLASNPTVTNCTFRVNSVNGDQSFGQGGGVYNGSNSNSTFTSCVFAGNNAGGDGADGGAMYNSESDPLLINCLFTNNEACEGAGGMTNSESNPVLINCTFSHTLNSLEGALLNFSDSNPTVIGCILWDTGMPPITGRATVTYSCIQGGWRGIGNIEANPNFVDPDGPDNDIFTWEDNDYRLSSGSPCIDAGNNWGVPLDENDYDEDDVLCELFPVDLDGSPRFNADEADFDPGCGVPVVVDMGAYEYQFDPADQVTFADLNGDDAVGAGDILGLLASWGPCGKGCCLADLNLDGTVGASDLLALLANWGPCP